VKTLLVAGIVLALFLEPTVGARLARFGGTPRLLLGVVVYFSLLKGGTAGTLFGLLLGLVADLTSLHTTGLNMLSFSICGFMVGQTWEHMYKDNALTQAMILFLVVLLHESILYMVVTKLDLGAYFPYLLRFAVPNGIATAIVFPLGLLAVERMFRREISFDARRVVVRRRR